MADITVEGTTTAISLLRQFNNFYSSTASDMQQVISVGTSLYNDPTMPLLFPQTWPAYQQYLINLNNVIQTFLGSLPVAPSLDPVPPPPAPPEEPTEIINP